MTPESGTRPALDTRLIEQIRDLARQQGDGLLRRIVDQYASSSARLLEQIGAGMRERDAESVARASHSLASSSGTVGALPLLELARSLESAARAGGLDGSAPLLDAVEAEWARALPALREALLGS